MEKNFKKIAGEEQPANENLSTFSQTNDLNGKEQQLFIPVPEENKPKKLTFMEVLAKLSPGKSLRIALDDILEGKTGALIVVDCEELKDIIEGGFRINCSFTNQRLAELAKMDGAIILSNDLKRILFSNVLLVPNSKIPTNETGTRHKAAERTAKQTGTIVIAVSERRNKISLFYEDKKYILENSENLLRRATETLNILEKQREIFDEILKNLNVLEMTRLVSIGDVCSVLQRIEVIIKMTDTMKRYLTELGNQGIIIRMRVREMFKGIELLEEQILQDYSSKPQNLKKILSEITFEGVIDIESLSRLLFENSPDTQIIPKGYRLLSKLNLTEREIFSLIETFGNLSSIFEASDEELNKILKAKTPSFRKEFENLREQILIGKKV
jgi:diadenylate cyclase